MKKKQIGLKTQTNKCRKSGVRNWNDESIKQNSIAFWHHLLVVGAK